MEEVPTSSPVDPPFGLVLLYWIYMIFSHSSFLEVTLEPYQRYEIVAIVGMVRQIWWTHQLFCFKFHSQIVLVHLPPATWQPLIGPRGDLSLGHTTLDQVSTPCQLYGFPFSMIRLVHISVQNAKIWVTRGSLWCCHIIMLMSSCHMSLPYSCHVSCTDDGIIYTDVDVSTMDANSSPADWARLTKL
jgi:hypothetical protein